ncbi:mitochondrial inner membrane protein [Microstroma glucosiphilum]|uniref:Succinate dehydrogenase [ubiquinone] cytochrome b small subunit n=1 Tax=Pseudomicrostroma glucosiphilum TaxID=1684307 RepID=A0A316U629_9BASI|nr:mitochondrial inner membrane protein [Pseudomicrostroma glucosiphilum]PWN20717.1 mitochondrial inner membrane protein [Pseudomicrostroma glucosiphilum]
MASLRTASLLPMRFASTSSASSSSGSASHLQPHLLRRAFSTSRSLPASHPAATASKSYIQGTVNEPTTFPPPSPSHGHYHWMFERAISVALLPITAAAVAKHGASGLVDASLGLTLVIHSHMGFDCALQDYLHERKFPIMGKIAPWALRAASVGTLYGLYELQTNDVGLSELIARVWTA